MRWIGPVVCALAVVLAACDGDDGGAGVEASSPPPPPPPIDASPPADELLGRRACNQLFPAAEVATALGVAELAMPVGYSRGGEARLRCLYVWPETGSPEVSVELRLACRPDRPKPADLASLWDGATVLDGGVSHAPAPNVFQRHREVSLTNSTGCYLGVTTGFLAEDRSAAAADVAAARLDSRTALILGAPR